MRSSVFLSYGRKDDEAFVAALHGALRHAGFDVWYDRVSLPNRGLSFYQEIRDAIETHDRLIAVLGPAAVVSPYVRSEWQYALVAGKQVTPLLRIGGYELLPAELQNLDCPDFSGAWNVTKFAKLVTDLGRPAPPLGRLFDLPAPPPHFQPRIEELEAVSRCVLPDLKSPVIVALNDRATVVHGMGGVGKSVIAAAFARNLECRRAFPDGVIWLDLRDRPSRSAPLAAIGECFGEDSSAYADADSAAQLADCLREKRCLIVLDNAEYLEQVQPVRQALGHATRLLVTTQQRALASSIGAREVELGVLTTPTALALLADWSGVAAEALPNEAESLVERCGRLAFALALCGASLRHGASVTALLNGLERADLGFLRASLAGYERFDTVTKCLQYSVELLAAYDAAAAERYLELVIFAARPRVPEHVIERFWKQRAALPEYRTQALLAALQGRSLVHIDDAEGGRRHVVLHDLHRLYLRARTPQANALHASLLDAYAASCPGGWPGGPNDGYFFQHISEHFAAANRAAELTKLLTVSPEWMKASARALNQVQQFHGDVEIALAHETHADRAIALVTSRCVASRLADRYDEKCLRAMVRLGRREEAKNAVRLALDRPSGWYLVLAVYDEIAECGAEDAELRELCLNVAKRHRRPEVRAGLRMNVAAILAAQDTERAVRLFREARDLIDGLEVPQQRQTSLVEFAMCLVRADRTGDVDALLPKLAKEFHQDFEAAEASLLARWVEKCCRADQRDRALEVVERARSSLALCWTLSTLLTSVLPKGADEQALVARLVAAARKGSNLLRVQSIAAALPALIRIDEQQARKLIAQAFKICGRLDPFPQGDYEAGLMALIQGFCRSGRPDYIAAAIQVSERLADSLDLEGGIANYPRRCEVAGVLEEIARALVRAELLDAALELVSRDPSEFAGSGIAGAITHEACIVGHPRAAGLLEATADMCVAVAHRDARTECFCALADEARSRKDHRVEDVFLQAAREKSLDHPLSLVRVVRSLAPRNYKSAMEIAFAIDHETERGRSIAGLILWLVKSRRDAAAKALIRQLRKRLPNQIVRAQVLAVLFEELAIMGRTKDAEQVLRATDMPRSADHSALLESGAALRLNKYDAAIQQAMRIEWIWSRDGMLNAIASRLTAVDRPKALRVYMLMRQTIMEAQEQDDPARNTSFANLALQMATAGFVEEGLVVASQIVAPAVALAARARVHVAAAERRELDDVLIQALLAELRALPAEPGREDATNAIATLFASLGRFTEAESLAGEIESDEMRRLCLSNMSRWCVKRDEFVTACRWRPDGPLEDWLTDLVAWAYHLEQAGGAKWPEPVHAELRRAQWSAAYWGDVADILMAPRPAPETRRRGAKAKHLRKNANG